MNVLTRNGWGLVRHTQGEIVVTHKNGSGCLIREGTENNNVSAAESLFYQMMNDFLLDNKLTKERDLESGDKGSGL